MRTPASWSSRFQRYRAAKVLGLHSPGPMDRVLDLGCGWGTLTRALASHARQVTGLDISEEAVRICVDLPNPDNVQFRLGDARVTGFPDGSLDAVYAADLLEHLHPWDTSAVLREARRVLRPGGHFVIWTPCTTHIVERLKARNIVLKTDETHMYYETMRILVEDLRWHGFGIDSRRYVESHWPVFNMAERLCQGWLPLLRRRIGIVARRPGEG